MQLGRCETENFWIITAVGVATLLAIVTQRRKSEIVGPNIAAQLAIAAERYNAGAELARLRDASRKSFRGGTRRA